MQDSTANLSLLTFTLLITYIKKKTFQHTRQWLLNLMHWSDENTSLGCVSTELFAIYIDNTGKRTLPVNAARRVAFPADRTKEKHLSKLKCLWCEHYIKALLKQTQYFRLVCLCTCSDTAQFILDRCKPLQQYSLLLAKKPLEKHHCFHNCTFK